MVGQFKSNSALKLFQLEKKPYNKSAHFLKNWLEATEKHRIRDFTKKWLFLKTVIMSIANTMTQNGLFADCNTSVSEKQGWTTDINQLPFKVHWNSFYHLPIDLHQLAGSKGKEKQAPTMKQALTNSSFLWNCDCGLFLMNNYIYVCVYIIYKYTHIYTYIYIHIHMQVYHQKPWIFFFNPERINSSFS